MPRWHGRRRLMLTILRHARATAWHISPGAQAAFPRDAARSPLTGRYCHLSISISAKMPHRHVQPLHMSDAAA